MGLKIVLPVSLTDTTAPKLAKYDPLESAGSLLLIEPNHVATPWAAGVPANNAVLPNVVEEYALAALGSSTPSHVRPVLLKPAAFTGSAGLLERTSKGALHGISPQGGNAVAQSGPAIQMPTQLIKYLLDHSKNDAANHKFYLSLWFRLTRSPGAAYGNSNLVGINGNGQQTNSALFNFAPNPTPASAPGVRPVSGQGTYGGGAVLPNDSTLAEHFIAAAANWWHTVISGVVQSAAPIPQPGDGTQTSVTGLLAGGSISFGSSIPVTGIGTTGTTGSAVVDPTGAGSGANKDKAASWIFRRLYLEDLTVSGRTYDQVAAIDQALYTKEVLTAGGRYYGDTYTNPTTIP